MTDRSTSNFQALTNAFTNIRVEARTCLGLLQKAGVTDPEIIASVNAMEDIADRVHNVPGFMLEGIKCDAMHLLHRRREENGVTGFTGVELTHK